MYSPDPYVTVRLLGTPNPIQKTKHVSKTCDPEWNETFQFYMDPKKDRVIGKLSNTNNNKTNIYFIFILGIFRLADSSKYDNVLN